MFGYENKTPHCIYALKQIFEKPVDSLLLSNTKNLPDVLIKDLNKFRTNKTKHHVKKFLLILVKTLLQPKNIKISQRKLSGN